MSEDGEKRVQKRPRVHERLLSSWEEIPTEPGSSNNPQEWFKKEYRAEQISKMEYDIVEKEIYLLKLKKIAGRITQKEYEKEMKKWKKKRDASWTKNAEEFYDALYSDRPDADRTDIGVWCHISGRYLLSSSVKAAHLVPEAFSMDDDELVLKHLFGKERGASEIGSPTNSLMLSKQVKSWFDKYLFVIVPVIDPLEVTQVPNNIITRWKVELISPDVENMTVISLINSWDKNDALPKAEDTLDQRELVFLNQNRPASRFLFFRFMLALIRIRQLDRRGWEDVWAKYHTYKPFAATPTGRYYARTGMLPLLAMAGHNGITAPEEEIEEFLRLNEAEEVPRIISLLRF